MMLEIFVKVQPWMFGLCLLLVAAVIVAGGLLYVINTPRNNGDDIDNFFN